MVDQGTKIEESSSRRLKTTRIICPLCSDTHGFSFHRLLVKHLTEVHEVKIIRSSLQFSNFDEFTFWRNQGSREVDYVCHKTRKDKKGEKLIIYDCNRSDTNGYSSSCRERKKKISGSIKMKGMCPSRIEARILINGQVFTDFIETHVGHEDELWTKKLKKTEELQILEKLEAGIPNKRILRYARDFADNDSSKMNVLTPQDLRNIRLRHNIDNQRHKDDMTESAFMFEQRSDSDLDEVKNFEEDKMLCFNEPTSQMHEMNYFMKESGSKSFNCYNENLTDAEYLELIHSLDKEKRRGLNAWLIACTEGLGEI